MKKVKDLLFFLPFYAYGELGDVVRSSLGARGEQGGVLRGAVTENPPDNKNPHAEQSHTGTIYKHEGTAGPSPLLQIASRRRLPAADP